MTGWGFVSEGVQKCVVKIAVVHLSLSNVFRNSQIVRGVGRVRSPPSSGVPNHC
jgi:hypothetical protein